jgi:ABC-2 type transport system ATP-binding protein
VKPAVDKNGNGAGEARIEVEGLWRYYGAVPALKNVSFKAYRGEIVGFLGPNGAGKSTTMRILAGFMPPSSGAARVAGFDVVEQSIQARGAIGYLPENTPLYTDMTVCGYLRYMAALRGVADRREAVERVMARVGIDHRADDLIGQLSKGLRQRVGLAQALVHDPEVIILDEPTIGLDPTQIREVQGLIRELGGAHTVILSTHILAEAEEISDRILIIRDGSIVADDALERLADQFRHGTETVRIVVPASLDVDAVTRALAAVQRVVTVKAEGEGAYTVTAEAAGAARPALAEAVVKAGWPLLELTPVLLTLQDIYLQSTAEVASMPDVSVAADAGEDTAGASDDDDPREEV